jgi:type IX secretion system PorP/SprF family membrane protein
MQINELKKMSMKTPLLRYGLCLLMATSVCGALRAQQDAITSQFTMNKLFINPGYAGYKEQGTLTLAHRNQWIGFKGAPMTTVISYDTPLKKNELAVGGGLMYDKVGPTSRLMLTGYFAYRLRLSNRATLSWGAVASASLYQANLTDLVLTSEHYGSTDDAFLFNTRSLVIPNIGFGGYYFKKDHFIGISIPAMIRPRLEKRTLAEQTHMNGRYEPTIYITGGKMFKINKDLNLNTSLLSRATLNSPLSIGAYVSGIYAKNYTLGLYYHYQENAGIFFQWQIDKQIKVGYSFDVATNMLIRTNFGSHELAVNYALGGKKKRIVYPRYF